MPPLPREHLGRRVSGWRQHPALAEWPQGGCQLTVIDWGRRKGAIPNGRVLRKILTDHTVKARERFGGCLWVGYGVRASGRSAAPDSTLSSQDCAALMDSGRSRKSLARASSASRSSAITAAVKST